MTARERVIDALRDVYDPCCADRGISVVDMGLVEDVRVDGSRVEVDIVLTTGWCPFVASMSDMIPARLRDLDGVESVGVEVVWDPVWTTDRLSPSARDKLSMPMEELLPHRERRLANARRGPAAAESGRDREGLLTARRGPAAAESGREGLVTAREGG